LADGGGHDVGDVSDVVFLLRGDIEVRDGNGSAPHRGVPSHPHPHLTIGDTFSHPVSIGFGAEIGFPIRKLNSNDFLIILWFFLFFYTIIRKKENM
jgi:hypothetical protein